MSKRAKREVETHGQRGYLAMMGRMIAAAGRRVADGDPEDLRTLMDLQEALDAAIEAAVAGQRQSYSWGQIAAGAGLHRQNLHRKFAHVEGVTGGADMASSVA